MSGESDSDIAYFCDVTSATPQLARDYLEVSQVNGKDRALAWLNVNGKLLNHNNNCVMSNLACLDGKINLLSLSVFVYCVCVCLYH